MPLVKTKTFCLRYQINEGYGKIQYSTKYFNSLYKLRDFLKNTKKSSKLQPVKFEPGKIIEQLWRIQLSITKGQPTHIDLVTECYEKGRVLVGCPVFCHENCSQKLPIFKGSILNWRVFLTLQIFETNRKFIPDSTLNTIY